MNLRAYELMRNSIWKKHGLKIGSIAFALFFMVSALSPAVYAASNVKKQKRKLTNIQKQIELKQKELKKYKKKEDSVKKEIRKLRKKERQALSRHRKLNKILSDTKKESKVAKTKYSSLRAASKHWTKALSGELVLYFFNMKKTSAYFGREDLAADVSLKAIMREKVFLVHKAKGTSLKMKKGILKLKKKDSELKSKRRSVIKERRSQNKRVARKRTELNKVEKEHKRKREEIENLKNDAKSLLWLIKKLESRSPYKKRMPANKKYLSIEKHSLSWPVQGKIISKFGRENLPRLKTWIVHDGIKIETQIDKAVFPVRSGNVIYAGPFRSYGNVVILDHEEGFFTIYGFLKSISVEKNEPVNANTVIGRAGIDKQSSVKRKGVNRGTVYFEIRAGTNAINPVTYLRRK
ncbi:MAG: peptidoglycan DD-metalloendopeptidase family protein [Elusimicrobiales bacterium]|nr:peptidoglycan DD-metalloendopeptidase family protein [Elusimicrobiales bacterium]